MQQLFPDLSHYDRNAPIGFCVHFNRLQFLSHSFYFYTFEHSSLKDQNERNNVSFEPAYRNFAVLDVDRDCNPHLSAAGQFDFNSLIHLLMHSALNKKI